MAGIVLNEKQFLARLGRAPRVLQRNYTRRIRLLIDKVTLGVMNRTPVHTGQTLNNWVWTNDAPSTSVLPAAGGGPTGRTSQMPLGSEPRRPANEGTIQASSLAVQLKRPWRRFFLSNNAPNVELLEAGVLPDATTSRSPAGMLGITLLEAEAFLRSTKKGLLR